MRTLPKSKLMRFLLVVIFLVGGYFISIFYDLPSVRAIPESLNQPSVRITDRNGRLLYELIPEVGGRNTPPK